MVKGIGVDMVNISEIERFMKQQGFVKHTFTKQEAAVSEEVPNSAEYLAARFAAKEAVFKAVGHLTKAKEFDLRMVETLNEADGNPYVNVSEEIQILLEEAGITKLHISITTEGDYATAFVVAVDD